MGLKDLVDDENKSSSTGRKSQSKSVEEREDVVTFGSGEYKKTFKEEKWERIKKILTREMGLVPNEVVNNFSQKTMFEALHEAALIDKQEMEKEDRSYTPKNCSICGDAVAEEGFQADGKIFHKHHTVGQLKSELDE